jgi:hypothetical protein
LEVAIGTTIVDGYSMKQFLVFYNETNIPTVDEKGEIGVRKCNILFGRENKMLGILID